MIRPADLDPITIFHEPINIRADNAERIARHARYLGISLNTDVFATRESWRKYALGSLHTVERLTCELQIAHRLHLWPDKALGTKKAMASVGNSDAHRIWLNHWWNRISERRKQDFGIHQNSPVNDKR